jgi:hypothetical protein
MVETFLEATLWKPFQLFLRILNYVSSNTKVPSSVLILVGEQVRIAWSQVRGVWGSVVTLFFAKKSKTGLCWSIVVNEKSAVCSPFSRTFPSDRTTKATKDVNVHLFTPVTILVNSISEFRELLKLLRIIITVARQLNFVYCIIKNLRTGHFGVCLRPRLKKGKKCYKECIRWSNRYQKIQ